MLQLTLWVWAMKKVLGWQEKVNSSPPNYTSGTDYGNANLKYNSKLVLSPVPDSKVHFASQCLYFDSNELGAWLSARFVSFSYLFFFFFFLTKLHSVMKVEP